MGQAQPSCCTATVLEKPTTPPPSKPKRQDDRKEKQSRKRSTDKVRKNEKKSSEASKDPGGRLFNTAPPELLSSSFQASTTVDPPEVKTLKRRLSQRNEVINGLNREAVWRSHLIEVLETENFEKMEMLQSLQRKEGKSNGVSEEFREVKALVERKDEEAQRLQSKLSSTEEMVRSILVETRAKGDAAEELVKVLSRQAHLGADAQQQLRRLERSSSKYQDGSPSMTENLRESGTPTPLLLQGNSGDNVGWDRIAWSELLENQMRNADIGSLPPLSLFERFRKADDVMEIYNCFAHLFALAGGWGQGSTYSTPWYPEGRNRYPYEAICSFLPGHLKAKQLLEILDGKARRSEYTSQPCSGGKLAGQRILVIGAGPVGLRTAIELRLLGASVTVVEKACAFDRVNRLVLCTEVFDDLKELGALCLEPPAGDFGLDPGLIHIGTNELQVLLFKSALLLGIQIFFGTTYVGSQWSASNNCWRASVSRSPVAPGPRAATYFSPIAVVIGADGINGVSRSNFDIGVSEASCHKAAIVGSFKTRGVVEDQELRSFSLSQESGYAQFEQFAKETGISLTNVTYMNSKQSHCFMMTPTLKCLIDRGVVYEAKAPLLGPENINHNELKNLLGQVAAFPFKPDQLSLVEVLGEQRLEFHDGGPSLIDFSKLQQAAHGAALLRQPQTPPLFCFLVGDTLMESFWPDGLGITRGFLSATKCASVVSRWASSELTHEEAVELFATAYGQLKDLSTKANTTLLHKIQDDTQPALKPPARYISPAKFGTEILPPP